MVNKRLLAALCLLTITACAGAGAARKAHDPDALWRLVNRCSGSADADWPADCVAVWADPARRAVVLKDSHGRYQYLLLPLPRLTGIEDDQLRRAALPNYFALAWQARGFVAQALGRPVPRRYMSLALNSPYGRSQNQFHIHLDCLREDVAAALARQSAAIGPDFAALPEPLRGHRYLARRLDGAELTADPLHLLEQSLAGDERIDRYSLVVAGTEDAAGPGFVVLATRFDPLSGNFASGEELQDHACGALTGAKALDGVR